MVHVGILDTGYDINYGQRRSVEELLDRDAKVTVFHPEEVLISVTNTAINLLYKNCDLAQEVDVCLIRRTRSAPTQAVELIHFLDNAGVICVDGVEAFDSPLSKALTLMKASGNIPVPETLIVNGLAAVDSINWEIFPCIIKPLLGFKGEGVSVATGPNQMQKALKQLLEKNQRVLIQRHLDIINEYRVTVVNDKVVAVCLKELNNEDLVTRNFARGATMRLIDKPELHGPAVNFARRNYCMIAGVDMVETTDGIYLLECNRCPGFEGVEGCGVDVAGEIAEFLIDLARKK